MSGFKYQGTCFNNPGDFFQTTGNNHHTIIEFKNKYYIFYHAEWLNKQVFGSQKGYRTTHVDELPVNGSKLGNAKGTLKGVNQVKDVDGSALNYAASFAWQSGISVKGQGAVTQVNYGRGAWTGVSNVALGNAKSITLKASSSSGATVKICAGSENGTVLGYVDIPAGGSLQNVTGNLSGASGTKSLFFIASGNLTIESWQLGGGSGSNANAGNTGNANGNASGNANNNYNNNNGNRNNNNNKNNNNNNNNKNNNNSGSCFSKALGYNCCKSCSGVYYVDKDGEWGIENGQWCGMASSCVSYASIARQCKGAQGYPCCAYSCTAYEKDRDGEWSVENNDWCLINKAICK
jgi:arabinoxylan arabinofuranohydrolase